MSCAMVAMIVFRPRGLLRQQRGTVWQHNCHFSSRGHRDTRDAGRELPFLPRSRQVEIVTATEEVRRLAEEPEESQDNPPEWQHEIVRKVRAMLASSRCLQLPDRFRTHDWSIINEFAEAQHSKQVRQELLEAIHGAGAFRMFRRTIRRLGIEKSWYRFREEALADIARDWLGAHELPYR
jgi:hypothetical protein